ncbi:MAG: class I adenylate-forming enzyme family protein [Parvibaculaceae bacterium]
MILASEDQIEDYTARGWWGTETLDEAFRHNAEAHPMRLAVADPLNRADIDGQSPRRLTYGELDNEVQRCATALLDFGLSKDDVVAVQLPNVVDLLVVFLACWRLGLIVSPVPVQWRAHELGDILGFVGAKAVVTTSLICGHDHAGMMADVAGKLSSVPHLIVTDQTVWPADDGARIAAHLGQHPADANDAATICWTSGTEARPKGVPRSHNHWLVAGVACGDAAEVADGDKILLPFPLINMAAIGGMLMPWFKCAGTLVLHHPFDLPVFLRQLVEEKINYTVAPPAILTMLLKEEKLLASLNLKALRSVASGSAALSPWMVKTWAEKYGISVINIFGSNEGTCLISGPSDVPDPEDRANYFPRFGVKGLVWPARVSGWIETKLVDLQTGETITEAGKSGELLLKGATVFAGYFRAGDGGPEGAIDAEGFFHTGDVFEISGEENRFYRFVERANDIIIRGGMNISPGEIDGLLAGHPKVAEAAVVGVPDDVMGERICAVVVAKAGEVLTLNELREFLQAQNIAAYKLPERLEMADALPRNPVGKVLRRLLRERL